jgi:hypothetical protein
MAAAARARLSLVYMPGSQWQRWHVHMPLGWEMTSTGRNLVSGERDMLFEGSRELRGAARVAILTRVETLRSEAVINWYELKEGVKP